ncbi:hypothetical protein O3M35_013088 [Rhynocoris fuscipes]|uniref:Fatty acyl-CoA reductase n=1 Tax=Rhynocoris fuscipes TaxID=488301 RepID=A0AAW1CEU3_9HEMI
MDSIGIPEFYAGRDIFITGGTGFMGKILIEKLLRSCPDLNNIYILIRSRKGKTAEERWNELTDLPVFDVLKAERPDALRTQVKVLEGDVREEMLGLNAEHYKLLEDNVSVIFHAAATVRFNEPFSEAVQMNTYGTTQIVNLALNMKQLKVLVHVSTAYSNCQISEIEEKIYPPIADWKEVLKITEKVDPQALTILTDKYLNGLPNTYVFSKSLAEAIVWEVRDKIPLVIFRPTIVIASWKEPVPGWMDNVNGPVGMMIGSGKGIIRTVPCNEEAMADFTLVDCAIKAMIICAWKRATFPISDDENIIYNCATTYKNITNGEIHKMGLEIIERNPLEQILWYPQMKLHKNLTLFRLEAVYKHFLPALIIDAILKILGKKTLVLKINTKIHVALLALSYFLLGSWKFHNKNFMSLLDDIPNKDKEAFDFNFLNIEPLDYFENCANKGGRKYLLKEGNLDKDKAKRNFLILKYLHYTMLTAFRITLIWAAYKIYCSYTSDI